MGHRTLTRGEFFGLGTVALCAIGFSACDGDGARRRSRGASEPAADGSVVSTATMGAPRAAHTATALPGGGALVAGGFGAGEDVPLRSAEVYGGEAGGFVSVGAMGVPRQSHAATPLPDGRVLITGGYAPEGPLRSTEVYDPYSRRFSSTGGMGARRAGHEAVALPDGRVLVAGGVGENFEFLATAELYDPEEDRFSPTGSMSMARESHSATVLADGRVLVAGGHAGDGGDLEIFASAELYEPGTGRFVPAADMTMARHKHDALELADGRVLVLGGADAGEDPEPFAAAEIYDPTLAGFRGTGDMRHARYKLRGTSVLLGDGRVVVTGGADSPEVYDPDAGRFVALPGGYGRAPLFASAARLASDTVLLCGGYSRTDPPTGSAWQVRYRG